MPENLTLYFDGSCTKNPGGIAGFGWALFKEDKTEYLAQYGEICRGDEATNNVAEWSALLYALRYLKSVGYKGYLKIYGDSQLVINQINGKYKVNQKLEKFFIECKDILNEWEWKADWVARDKNQRCDELSKMGTQINKEKST